jgi:hypothetical protein
VLDFIGIFVDGIAMRTFVDATNAYAASINRNIHSRGWSILSVNELWNFFAIVTFLGTMKVRERRALWAPSSAYYNAWVATTMTVGRFEDILYCLHWVNTAALSPAEKAARNREDPFWPIQGFVAHLRERFPLYFHPGQHLDVDEQGIPMEELLSPYGLSRGLITRPST